MRTLLLILLLLYFASCSDNPKIDTQPNVATTQDTIKNQKKSDSLYSVAMVDNRSQRVFIVIDSNILADIKKIRTIIKEIDSKYIFRNDLNVSFVSDLKYAGNKTDLEETKGISFYEFYLNYLGEYNKKTKIFWTYPALADKKVKYILD